MSGVLIVEVRGQREVCVPAQAHPLGVRGDQQDSPAMDRMFASMVDGCLLELALICPTSGM